MPKIHGFRIACAFVLAAQLTMAGDFVKQLTPKDIKPDTKLSLVLPGFSATITCAIPLKEVKAINPGRIDPIAAPTYQGRNMDKGVFRPVPVPVCPSR
jgi:hypothetical protein